MSLPRLDRSPPSVMGLSFGLALLLRLLRLAEQTAADGGQAMLSLDSATYDTLARRLLAGEALGPYQVAPGYTWFLAGIYALSDHSLTAVYAVQAVLGAVTAALAAWLGGRLGGRLGALVAGLLTAIYPVAILYDLQLLSVTLSTALTVGGAVALLRFDEAIRGGRRAAGLALGAGLLLGLATVIRGNLLLTLPFLLLLVGARARPRWALVGLFALGLALPMAGTARHNAAAGSPALVSTNGGINLYLGNNPYLIDVTAFPFRIPANQEGLAERSRLIASVEAGRWLTPAEADRAWTRRALQTMASDPVRYTALFLRKVSQTLAWREYPDTLDHAWLQQQSWFLRYLPPMHGAVVALGLLGLVSRARRQEDRTLQALLVLGVASVALFFVITRYRLPLFPLWAAYAGAGARWLMDARPDPRRLRLGLAGAVGAALVLLLAPTSRLYPWNLLLKDVGDGGACIVDTHPLRDGAVEAAYSLALQQMKRGDRAGAEAALVALLDRDPGHHGAAVNLSYLLLARGAVDEAIARASAVATADPCDENAWFNLGNALYRKGNLQAAAGALYKARQIDVYDTEIRAALGQIYLSADRLDAAREELDFAATWDPGSWKARALRARVALKDKDVDRAIRLLREATELQPDQPDLWGLLGLAWLGKEDLEQAEVALSRGETVALQQGRTDPVLVALRSALDKPFVLPPEARVTLESRPVGPLR